MDKHRVVKSDGSYEEHSTEQQDSIEITCNAKGEYAWKVKAYDDDSVRLNKKIEESIEVVRTRINALRNNG